MISREAETRLWLDETSNPDYRQQVKAELKRRRLKKTDLARRAGCSYSNLLFYLDRTESQRIPKYMWRAIREYVFKDLSHLAGAEEEQQQ